MRGVRREKNGEVEVGEKIKKGRGEVGGGGKVGQKAGKKINNRMGMRAEG